MSVVNRRAVLFGAAAGAALPADAVTARRGLSLHIGVNDLDAGHYKGEFDPLKGAVADALLMEKICGGARFATDKLLCQQATRASVIGKIRENARKLQSGDLFVITFAGHGSQLPDRHGDEQDDHLDETWCLYDAQIRDDELRALWGEFAEGVRIVVISDSCHSGTVNAIAMRSPAKAFASKAGLDASTLVGLRTLPPRAIWATYEAHRAFYDATDAGLVPPPKCSVISISAAQDNEEAFDGLPNGAFTTVLSNVWNGGLYAGTYRTFTDAIIDGLGSLQRPNYEFDGAKNDRFEGQQVFFI